MGLVLTTNVPSLIAQRNLAKNSQAVQLSYEKLSTGLKINHAGDDVAGLSISETILTQIRGNQKAITNAQDGANILQIAEGALGVVVENLQRIRELTIQSANDSNSSIERRAIALEVQSRLDDIDRIAITTRSSNVNLLDGSKSNYYLQIGANSNTAQNTLDIGNILTNSMATALGIKGVTVTVSAGGAFRTNSSARDFLTYVDSALTNVFTRRSNIGAMQNRLGSVVQSLSVSIENLKYTNSRIRDLDIADETAKLTQAQVLQQAALNVLAQTNQLPNLSLKLLQ